MSDLRKLKNLQWQLNNARKEFDKLSLLSNNDFNGIIKKKLGKITLTIIDLEKEIKENL